MATVTHDETTARMGAPVAARKCGNYIVLERTDRRPAP